MPNSQQGARGDLPDLAALAGKTIERAEYLPFDEEDPSPGGVALHFTDGTAWKIAFWIEWADDAGLIVHELKSGDADE